MISICLTDRRTIAAPAQVAVPACIRHAVVHATAAVHDNDLHRQNRESKLSTHQQPMNELLPSTSSDRQPKHSNYPWLKSHWGNIDDAQPPYAAVRKQHSSSTSPAETEMQLSHPELRTEMPQAAGLAQPYRSILFQQGSASPLGHRQHHGMHRER